VCVCVCVCVYISYEYTKMILCYTNLISISDFQVYLPIYIWVTLKRSVYLVACNPGRTLYAKHHPGMTALATALQSQAAQQCCPETTTCPRTWVSATNSIRDGDYQHKHSTDFTETCLVYHSINL